MDESLEDLAERVDELTGRLDRVTGYHTWGGETQHHDRLDELERRVGQHDLDEVVEALEARVARLDDGNDRTGTTLRALQNRLRLLERRLRSSGAVGTADLDQWLDPVRALASDALVGLQAADRLMPAHLENQLANRINAPAALRQARAQHARNAITAVREAADAEPADHTVWSSARRRLDTAIDAVATLDRRLTAARADALAAESELGRARRDHNQAVPTVRTGRVATGQLQAAVRARLGEILSEELLLPVWFDRALGAPPGAPDTEDWLDTAVEVVTYRLIHRVHDPVLALGPRPDKPGHRQREHDRLLQLCADYH